VSNEIHLAVIAAASAKSYSPRAWGFHAWAGFTRTLRSVRPRAHPLPDRGLFTGLMARRVGYTTSAAVWSGDRIDQTWRWLAGSVNATDPDRGRVSWSAAASRKTRDVNSLELLPCPTARTPFRELRHARRGVSQSVRARLIASARAPSAPHSSSGRQQRNWAPEGPPTARP
jgi:hypothetical protein